MSIFASRGSIRSRGKLSQKLVRVKKAIMASSAHDFDVVMNDGTTKSMSVYKGKFSVV